MQVSEIRRDSTTRNRFSPECRIMPPCSQHGISHQVFVDFPGAAPSLDDIPDHQRLAPVHVPGCENAWYIGPVVFRSFLTYDRPAGGQVHPEGLRSVWLAAGKAGRDQQQVTWKKLLCSCRFL